MKLNLYLYMEEYYLELIWSAFYDSYLHRLTLVES